MVLMIHNSVKTYLSKEYLVIKQSKKIWQKGFEKYLDLWKFL